MSEDAIPAGITPQDRPARASDRLRGLAKHAYEPDPDTYLRNLRAEAEDRLATRAAARGTPNSAAHEPKASR